MGRPSRLSLAVLAFVVGTAAAFAQESTPLAGVCRDATTGEVIPWVNVVLYPSQAAQIADADGSFRFDVGSEPVVEVHAQHVAYGEVRYTLQSGADRPEFIELSMTPVEIELETMHVRGDRAESHRADQTPVRLDGASLRRQLGGTIAQTISQEPGLAHRSMGPAPARPVLRGLGGTRLLVLEDGANPGDLSATAADHSVVIDPLGAEAIEVVRGPAAFQYGSAVLAGVVDVQRAASRELPARATGRIVMQGASVSSEAAGHARLEGPLNGRYAYRLDAMGRNGSDLRTPEGRLGNTGIGTWAVDGALRHVGESFDWGVGGGRYESDYGIPGGFLGGHANGVDIELERWRVGGHAGRDLHDTGLRRIEARAAYSRYFHRELESNGSCGVSFGQLTYDGALEAEFGWERLEGKAGVIVEHRDFAAGCFSFITPTVETTYGSYVYQELEIGRTRFQGAIRFDARFVEPARADTNKAGIIRDRDFQGVSGGLSVVRALGAGFSGGLALSRSFRPPSIEELFSEGPHLAAYSYDIGNADLEAEHGTGLEASLEWDRGAPIALGAALFYNEFDRFILPLDSGLIEYGQGEVGFLPRYIYAGRPVVMTGGEVELQWRMARGLRFEGSASWVRGEFDDDAEDVPRIPPFSGRARLRYNAPAWSTTVGVRGAARQDQLGEFEEPTAAYLVTDATVTWRLGYHGGFQHTILLRGENLTDAAYRNHLSRIKSVFPEAGRNFALIYDVSF